MAAGAVLIELSRVPAACGPAPRPADRDSWAGLVGGGGRPEKAGQFAGAGDDGDVGGLAAGAHLLVDAVQAAAGAAGDLQHVVGLAGLADDVPVAVEFRRRSPVKCLRRR